jgi:hypothetical protein
MRWARAGMGKRGGIRVIYYHAVGYNIVVLITAYAKNTQENLTNDQKKAVRKLIETVEEGLRIAAGK